MQLSVDVYLEEETYQTELYVLRYFLSDVFIHDEDQGL